jgi:uncharacterized protein YndB with AHSA1/START domain
VIASLFLTPKQWLGKMMALKIALVVFVLIVVLLVFAATKPNSFRVQRSIAIHAPQEKVFSLINDLHAWDAWSEDAGAATVPKIYAGSASGIGATAEWHGTGRAGDARMTITESVAPSKVVVEVDWRRPFEARNLNEFNIQVRGDDTQVTWSILASNLYSMKLIGIFVDMQSEFGKHMESGLENLKNAAEKKEAATGL